MKRNSDNWKEIQENNKMIAEWLGYKYHPFDEVHKYALNGWFKSDQRYIQKISKHGPGGVYLCQTHRELMFHHDWNWLMWAAGEVIQDNWCLGENVEAGLRYVDLQAELEKCDKDGIYRNVVGYVKAVRDEK